MRQASPVPSRRQLAGWGGGTSGDRGGWEEESRRCEERQLGVGGGRETLKILDGDFYTKLTEGPHCKCFAGNPKNGVADTIFFFFLIIQIKSWR
uniref:Uncharacterized protein n=1 Tax=Oryza sativa subsp. japonica TaxID=39947 RepID=Q6K3B9_ORYSJ|nr:hypothetical protein [Oryza sativa Japonica Group]